jgi:hypothetical protein
MLRLDDMPQHIAPECGVERLLQVVLGVRRARKPANAHRSKQEDKPQDHAHTRSCATPASVAGRAQRLSECAFRAAMETENDGDVLKNANFRSRNETQEKWFGVNPHLALKLLNNPSSNIADT